MNISGIRTAGLALVTLLGAAHLSTVEATPLKVGSCDGNPDSCHDNATTYAQIYCHAMGKDNWSTVSYWCDGSTAHVTYVTCSSASQEPKDELLG
ncbi:MAG TPA: hypothetical protein VF710_23530 [Longimicrobium sp.]|jgi:hypothetical protein